MNNPVIEKNGDEYIVRYNGKMYICYTYKRAGEIANALTWR